LKTSKKLPVFQLSALTGGAAPTYNQTRTKDRKPPLLSGKIFRRNLISARDVIDITAIGPHRSMHPEIHRLIVIASRSEERMTAAHKDRSGKVE
jgi:hypothetical protein